MSRILFATIGSLGDLHPMMAIGIALKSRGHEIVFATSAHYHNRLEQMGFETCRLRPDTIEPNDLETLSRLMDLREGTGLLLRDYIFKNIRDTYEDICRFASGADALIVGELVYAGQLVARRLALPWAFLALSPSAFFSKYDLPVLPGLEPFAIAHKLGPVFNKFLVQIGQLACHSWPGPYYQLQRELGLPEQENPIFYGKYSPYLVLAAFSKVMGTEQKDWPPNAFITGFAYHDSTPDLFDKDKAVNLQRMTDFLAEGEAPIVFTLGSAAMFVPGSFYEESREAAGILGRRAIFLMGQNSLFTDLPKTMAAFDYLPFQEIFPAAAAIVHQAGIGTCAQILRAGKPSLCVPYSHDQPDNAVRLRKLGTSLTLHRSKYKARRVAAKLETLLNDQSTAAKARLVAQAIEQEDGSESAADHIEKMIADRDLHQVREGNFQI